MRGISTYTAQVILIALFLSLLPIFYIDVFLPIKLRGITLLDVYRDEISLEGVKVRILYSMDNTLIIYNYGWKSATIHSVLLNGSEVAFQLYYHDGAGWRPAKAVEPGRIYKLILSSMVEPGSEIALKVDYGVVRCSWA